MPHLSWTRKSCADGVLLRCLDDVDDEVRDRAAMYLKVMKEDDLAEPLVKDGALCYLAILYSYT